MLEFLFDFVKVRMVIKSIENFLYKIADMEFVCHDDRLSKMVKDVMNDEVSEVMLEFVSAASTSDYDKFQKCLEGLEGNK